MTEDQLNMLEKMIDEQQDPMSRGVSMILLRMIQEDREALRLQIAAERASS